MSEDEECTLDDEPQEEGEETEIARVTMLEGRVRELEQAVVELDDTTQAFKLLAEKQAAEINAKELLLTRKSEYVDELLEQLKVLGGKLEARTAEVQTLESRALKLEAQATELREQVHKDEEDFAMVCAALDAREQMLAKKNSDLAVAAETEKQLRKELERHQGAIRRLEKNVEDLQPEKADACLSPRSFHENQLIRLRDDAIEAKTREVWLLTGQNDQLRVQLDELETALENLQSNVISKENDLVRRQRKIDRLETEIDALQVSRSQAEGREKAMEIATTQNAKLLQALEAQERSTEEMKARLEDCERECEQLRNTHREHIARSAESEVEVLHRTRQAEEKASIVSSLQEKLRRERKLLQEELSSSHLNYQMEIEKVQSELVMRRNKQYDLTLKLQDVEARLHEAVDRRESADEQLLAAQCRMQELERVLQDSLQCKKKLEEELESQKKRSGASVEKQNKILSEAKREIAALQKQLEGMKEALAKKLIQEKQHELRHLEEKQVFSAQEALAREQKERIHRLVRDVNRESQMRAGVELEKAAIKDQLETLRQQTENIIRECLEQKQQIQDKKQQLTEKFWQLTNEFHAVQSAKTKLVVRFADACTRAASASVATAAICAAIA
ncbi:LPXTG-motif cell wall anchor domain protein [Phytophthora boehmeriae]|uniref:LPXTG-motif cell wall anchor domain protein n=1 Tax=Phytophthora boehmeriae TaxID=109152 RepID=A0A8T1WSL8_9STRA|nr:LPXTG-motif cell wall anchor domain protein [Phytophthora boehmeriae]